MSKKSEMPPPKGRPIGPVAPTSNVGLGEELRYRILRYLKDVEHELAGQLGIDDIANFLDAPADQIRDQIDILEDLGAISASRRIDGDAKPRLKGRGKALLEEIQDERSALPTSEKPSRAAGTSESPGDHRYNWDAFIAHASEDKDPFVRSLAGRLSQHLRNMV